MSLDISYLLVGFFLGILGKALYDELKAPKLEIGVAPSPDDYFRLEETAKIGEGIAEIEHVISTCNAYRIKVYNKEKRILNTAAENCIGWLELSIAKEPYQTSWVGELSSVTINVGDSRELNVCARDDTGKIITPTERGYFKPAPRVIGDGKKSVEGLLRITSQNTRKEEKKIVIEPIDKDRIKIQIL